jgi:hypothetical protein
MRIRNWDKWQSYRTDRGTPPWIKIHRNLLSNPEWASLSDAEKGQLVSMWIIAADKKGELPGDAAIIRKICMLDDVPNLNKFKMLGFIEKDGCQDDAKLATTCQPDDPPETETETETEERQRRIESLRDSSAEVKNTSTPEPEKRIPVILFPVIGGEEFHIFQEDVDQWQETFPGIKVMDDLRRCRQWNIDNPKNRKTKTGIRKHISAWLGRTQDKARPGGARQGFMSQKDKTAAFYDEANRKIREGVANGTINLGFDPDSPVEVGIPLLE